MKLTEILGSNEKHYTPEAMSRRLDSLTEIVEVLIERLKEKDGAVLTQAITSHGYKWQFLETKPKK